MREVGRVRKVTLLPFSDNTEYRILMYIKLPMFLFYMAHGLNDFDAGKSITRAIGRRGTLVMDVACIKIITSSPI
jgi:hypothetical protein